MDLQDIDHYPTTPTARRNNIEKTLQFLRTEGVILHQDAVKGVAARERERERWKSERGEGRGEEK